VAELLMAEVFDGRIEVRWYCTPSVSRSKPEMSKNKAQLGLWELCLNFSSLFYSEFLVKSILIIPKIFPTF